ncbi:MAG TPA: iron-containing redox enzyme family protein [Polyangiales bacterium]|nr:iron-containing redox enzyme family protein [Polyangiales bacterium]
MIEQLERCTASMRAAAESFPWQRRDAYAGWLAQTYFYVRHSTRLLACAGARFEHGERGDALHYRFAAHITEEKKHEQLCVHDLKQLGLSLDAFPERHSTRLFYEPQYYKIEHQSPSALFGYIVALEAFGPAYGPQIVQAVTGAFGPRCASFLELHAEEDEDHIQKALAMISTVPERERAWVLENLEQTTYAYQRLLADLASVA